MARFRPLALLADEVAAGVDALEMTDEAVQAAVDSPEPAVAEVADTTLQMEMDVAEIGESEADAEALEGAADVLKEGAEAGEAISPIAAEAIRILAQRITSRHQGIQSGGLNIAAESFKSKKGAVAAQRLAMESLESFAKNIWKQIIKAYENVIEFFKKWWAKFFDGATKLRDRADSLAKTVKSKAGKLDGAGGEKKIDTGSWGIHLQNGGKLETAAIGTTALQLEATYNKFCGNVTAIAGEMLDAATAAMNGGGDKAGAVKIAESVASKLGAKKDLASHLGEAPEGMETIAAELPFGDKALYFRGFASGASAEDAADNVSQLKFWMDEVKGYKDVSDVQLDVAGVKADSLEKACNGVKNMAIQMIKDKSVEGTIDGKAKKVKERAAKLASLSDNSENDERSEEIRYQGAIARGALNVTSSGLSQIRSYFMTTGNAVLSFVQAALSHTGAKDDKSNTRSGNT